ncbi:MAG: DUF2135 domain-containing protein, partial [Desulfobulbaceae bacterium]|nr:DUF2135 domain-containing protein [Desulfobulbaceae bacterium]
NSQANSHGTLLHNLAHLTGGLYLNLLRTPPEKAPKKIIETREPIRISKVDGCEDISITNTNGRVNLLGRVTEKICKIELSSPDGPDTIVIEQENIIHRNIIGRNWAGLQAQKIALINNNSTKEKLVDLGRKYGLVTPGTSLLVLEDVEQYLEYDIEPPASLTAMLEEFHRRKITQKRDLDQEKQAKVQAVLAMWQQRISWWEKEFRVDPHLLKEKKQSQASMFSPEEQVLDGMVAPDPIQAMAREPMMNMDMELGAALSEEADEEEMKTTTATSTRSSIKIKPWSPDTPYLKVIKAAKKNRAYAAYLIQRRDYAASPAFFLDCGDYFLSNGQSEIGLRVLSNLVEMGLDDAALIRMYAWRLQQAGEFDTAISLLERVRADREDEPQSHRDLALALSQRWQESGHKEDAVRAMELLYQVILGDWPNFPEIEIIGLMELNRLIHLAGLQGISPPTQIDPRFIKLLDLDIRISMSWDSDLTDVDLHLFEPTGEHAYYGHNLTQIGGLVSRDFTRGYGPEEYVLKKALAGKYIIKAHYYGSSQQSVTGACTVYVTVFTNYGRENEKKQILTLRLERPSDNVQVGEITIDGLQNSIPEPKPDDWKILFNQLKIGMTIDQITAVLGQPAEIQGHDKTVLIYRPAPDTVIHITMAPTLISVQQIMGGAVLDLIPTL